MSQSLLINNAGLRIRVKEMLTKISCLITADQIVNIAVAISSS